MELIVGTYEELILGYRILENDEGQTFTNSFTDHSHTGSVRSVAINTKGILATGSTDETIKLFSLRKRVEVGSLMHHEGCVTVLQFYGCKHMLSASEDGTIAVWQVGSWECLRTLRGHKGPVYSLSIHPSGKLALSIGKDNTLRTWNLIDGKCAYVTNLKQSSDLVQWSLDGDTYIVVSRNHIDVYSVQTAGIINQIQCKSRVSSVAYIQSNIVAVGCDGGCIEFHDITTKQKIYEFSSDTIRVKSMAVLTQCKHTGASRLAMASSDGFIKLYHIVLTSTPSHSVMAQIGTGFRLLCIAAAELSPQKPVADGDGSQDDVVKCEAEAGAAVRRPVSKKRSVVVVEEDVHSGDEGCGSRDNDDELLTKRWKEPRVRATAVSSDGKKKSTEKKKKSTEKKTEKCDKQQQKQ